MRFSKRLMGLMPDVYAQCDTSGDLQTFFNVIGPTLDDLKACIDGITELVSPNDCQPDFLSYLAALVGAEFDSTASPTPQRRKIQEAIERYRRTGTKSALARELAALGWTGAIIETYHSVLRLNYSSTLNNRKLPGSKYNHGIYYITQPLKDNSEFYSIAENHQPAGTICWFEEVEISLS
ncbi:MAG: phage tail protein [Armatimonadota bacterium]|nr:phage tail protein [bacterium]